ncbi:MAG TPA: CdaR family protein [Anaerolineales bacterium]|nr:CdaR family protein [Anaerolineales bacterium]
MLKSFLLTLWNSLGTLLLAFAIAFAVWVSAVVAADPNEERDFPSPLTLQVKGLDPDLVLIGTLPDQVLLRLSAPLSLWDRLTSRAGTVDVFIDLTGLGPGEHSVPVQIESELRPFRVVQVIPSEVDLALETLAVAEIEITPQVEGMPALGFELDKVSLNPGVCTVSGPETLMAQVAQVVARLDVSDARETVSTTATLQAVDQAGNVLSGLRIEPAQAEIEQTIVQAGGYRDVAVKVETVGQPSPGFRVTSISVNPPIVTLFSTDTLIVANLPGYVSTLPLDLSGAEEDLVTRLSLSLPQGVIVVGEQQSVEVVIGIAPIETSILFNVEVEMIGLESGLEAELSPQNVSVILSGPLSTLQSLVGDDIHLFVDLVGLQPGTYLIEPGAEIVPEDVRLLSVIPSAIEVIITRSP